MSKRLNPLGMVPGNRNPHRMAAISHEVAKPSGAAPAAIFRPGHVARTMATTPIPDPRLPATRHKASYGLDVQVQELSAHIKRKLHQLANLVHRGRYDQAGKVADIVSEARARLVLLAAGIEALEPEPEPAPILTKPKTHTVRKPKRYGRWSDK
jgi:hypothetical protein